MNIEEMQAQRDADYEKYKAEGRIWGTVPREKIVQILRHREINRDGVHKVE